MSKLSGQEGPWLLQSAAYIFEGTARVSGRSDVPSDESERKCLDGITFFRQWADIMLVDDVTNLRGTCKAELAFSRFNRNPALKKAEITLSKLDK